MTEELGSPQTEPMPETEETVPAPEEAGPAPPEPASEIRPPQEMHLRAERPPVTRLSRKVLIGISIAAICGIAAAALFALRPRLAAPPPPLPTANTASNTPDAVNNLPHDYIGVQAAPPLGPPLPGDLGKPMLNAGTTVPGMPRPALTPEEQRLAQEHEAARVSKLFVSTGLQENRPATEPTRSDAPGASPVPTGAQTAADPTSTENMQDRKIAFMSETSNHGTISPDRIQKPASPYVLQAGWVIAGALITGIKSDLPGDISAQVTENVYDSPTGHYLLIPQGSRLSGKYNSQISFGQTRVQMVWTRIIFPNGGGIELQRLPGADTEGYSGLEDDVDNHWGALFKAALLSTVLSVGAEAGTSNSENNLAQAIRQGASQSINQTGQQIVERNLNIQPTLTDRGGLPVRILVDRDLVLAPYVEEASQ